MAARTIPVFWQREGVNEVFGDYAQDCSPGARIKVILEGREYESFAQMGSAAREYSRSWDVTAVMPQWEQILVN